MSRRTHQRKRFRPKERLLGVSFGNTQHSLASRMTGAFLEAWNSQNSSQALGFHPRQEIELPPPPRMMTFREVQEEIRREGNGMTTGQVEDLLQGRPARVAMNEIRIAKHMLLLLIDDMDAVDRIFTDIRYRASNLRMRLENMESRLLASSTAPSPAPSQNENENN